VRNAAVRVSVVGAIAAAVVWLAWQQLPAIGAGALLHPSRRTVNAAPPHDCIARDVASGALTLRGWVCEPPAPVRGTIVYLHGIADNRESGRGVVARYLPRGYRVVAFDSRAHGGSDGDACTYGYYEAGDLRRIIDTLPAGPIVLIGTSLGAAVALQEAADDRRVSAVVAAETFSDLRTVATERAPRFFTRGTIQRAFRLAEHDAGFEVDAASPRRAAARITVPVLLIHGDADVDTPPAHSERVRAALAGPSRLILVPGAHHNESLRAAAVWGEVDQWIGASELTAAGTPAAETRTSTTPSR
jgi:uncharacterized protein